MSKLLRTEFARLMKNKLFYFSMLLMAGLSIFFMVGRYMDMKKYPEAYAKLSGEYTSADVFLAVGPIYEIIVAAVLLGTFIGSEYSYGTIRNKLIAGHKRVNIYLSDLIVCGAAAIILELLYTIITLVVGGCLFGINESVQNILSTFAVGIMALVFFAALYLFVVVAWASRSAGLASVILLGFMMIMAALTIDNKLSAPEYFYPEGIDSTTGEIIEMPPEKNIHYLTGTKRKVYEALYDILPVCHLYRIMKEGATADYVKMMAFSLVQTVAISGIGIFVFSGKDLK